MGLEPKDTLGDIDVAGDLVDALEAGEVGRRAVRAISEPPPKSRVGSVHALDDRSGIGGYVWAGGSTARGSNGGHQEQ